MGLPRMRAGPLRRAAALGPGVWHDLLRAVVELAIARARLGRWTERDLPRVAGEVFGPTRSAPVMGEDLLRVRRVAFAIPRVAARLPWRADCLVQALAAQHWLARGGIASTLSIGVSSGTQEGFLAHAWLEVGDELVTGGDIAPYKPFRMSADRRGT